MGTFLVMLPLAVYYYFCGSIGAASFFSTAFGSGFGSAFGSAIGSSLRPGTSISYNGA